MPNHGHTVFDIGATKINWRGSEKLIPKDLKTKLRAASSMAQLLQYNLLIRLYRNSSSFYLDGDVLIRDPTYTHLKNLEHYLPLQISNQQISIANTRSNTKSQTKDTCNCQASPAKWIISHSRWVISHQTERHQNTRLQAKLWLGRPMTYYPPLYYGCRDDRDSHFVDTSVYGVDGDPAVTG
ncbi:hypothetical protein P167DRAFT_546125 [Morchella conica CCBAS932]|uniref:Uncharacterized protein n=1 Tax=Morchella conica CCBAS932 TaxID=1392247 RepID=A0A3N4KQX2_9PEZI|nr:hypothetical protein P167DRAFT_546125 [Morchella conica CCBAS932]